MIYIYYPKAPIRKVFPVPICVQHLSLFALKVVEIHTARTTLKKNLYQTPFLMKKNQFQIGHLIPLSKK